MTTASPTSRERGADRIARTVGRVETASLLKSGAVAFALPCLASRGRDPLASGGQPQRQLAMLESRGGASLETEPYQSLAQVAPATA
jgi:hypothetical protein